jgi:excisionase family DNA binding protein
MTAHEYEPHRGRPQVATNPGERGPRQRRSGPPTDTDAPARNHVRLLTPQQVADRLGTPLRFVRRLIDERRIPYTKIGKYVRIEEPDVDAFIAAGRVEVVRPNRGSD